MTTAREQAREAAYADAGVRSTLAESHADAASDVWEPIVRAFVDAKAGTNEHGVYWNTAKLRQAYVRAKDALGEDALEARADAARAEWVRGE